MQIEVWQTIDRPPEVVFQFIAVEHIANHPRWDPHMELEQLTPGPIGLGTVVRRRHTRAGYPIEGSMEVVEFDAPRVIAWAVDDGGVEMHGRSTIEPEGATGSRLTIHIDIPGAPNPLDPMPIEASARRMKELIEAEWWGVVAGRRGNAPATCATGAFGCGLRPRWAAGAPALG